MSKVLSRFLSLIICLQLAVGCNAYQTSTTIKTPESPIPSGSIRINGIISKTFNAISDSLFPQAMAAEGKIIFYDVKDPGNPTEIYSESISGTDSFSVDLKQEDIASGLIRVRFEPADSDKLKEREFLTVASKKMTATMSNDESLKSEILLYQLNLENINSVLNLDLIKDRFHELKTTINLDQEVNRFGDSIAFKTLLADAGNREGMIGLLAHARVAPVLKNISLIDLQSKFYSAAQEKKLIKDDLILKCDYLGGSLYLNDIDIKRDFFMEADAVEKGLIEIYGQDMNPEKKPLTRFYEANDQIKELLVKLDSIAAKTGEIYSIRISFKSNNLSAPLPENECRLFPTGLSKDEYDKFSSSDPSKDLRFDVKLINEVDLASFQSVSAAQAAFTDVVNHGIESLAILLNDSGLSDERAIGVLTYQKQRAQYYVKEKIIQLQQILKTADVEFDKSYLDSVTTSKATTFWEALELLRSNYTITISDLKERLLVQQGMPKAEALPIFKIQAALASNYFVERLVYFHDYYFKLEDPSLESMNDDLTAIMNLDAAEYPSAADYQPKISEIYNQGVTGIDLRLTTANLSPSAKDRELLNNRLVACVKAKDHAGSVYFQNLFEP